MLAVDSWGAHQRKDFSEPRLLHLPIHREALNSLTGDVWFSLTNSDLLMFLSTSPLLQNSYVSWIVPSPPRSGSLGVTWGAASRAWSPKNSRQIKHHAQLLSCENIFQSTMAMNSYRFSFSNPGFNNAVFPLIYYIDLEYISRFIYLVLH